MNKVIHSKGKNNIDDLLDKYNKIKSMYEQTKDEKYTKEMELYLGIMKAATTSLTIKVGPKIPFE